MSTPVAVVTGASRGIGREVAAQLEARGFEVVRGVRDPARAEGVHLDVADGGASARARATSLERCDVLVNNAAINYDTWQTAAGADLGTVRETLETNLLGAWACAQAFLPLLRASGAGRIVNVSSGAGSFEDMTSATPAYSVSKAALNALTVMLADDLRADGVKVNAVCPGWARTDMGGPSATRSVAVGAAGVVWAATLGPGGPTGGFFRDGRPIAW